MTVANNNPGDQITGQREEQIDARRTPNQNSRPNRKIITARRLGLEWHRIPPFDPICRLQLARSFFFTAVGEFGEDASRTDEIFQNIDIGAKH